jgi:hypothetical protein
MRRTVRPQAPRREVSVPGRTVAGMTANFSLTLDCHDPRLVGAFWRTALGYVDAPPPPPFATRGDWYASFGLDPDAWPDDAAWLCDPAGLAPSLSILRVPEAKTVKNRMHIDIRVPGDADRDVRWGRVLAERDRLVAAGGTVLAEHDGHHVVLADPEGNELCVAVAAA